MRGHQANHGLFLRRVGQIEGEGHVFRQRMGLEPHLHEEVDLVVLEPVGPRRLEGGEAESAAPVHLAALHRQRRLLSAQITGDNFEFCAQNLVQDRRIGVRSRASAGARHRHHGLFGLLQRLDRGGEPGGAEGHILFQRADGGEIGDAIGGLAGSDQRLNQRAGGEGPENRAVLGRLADQIFEQPHAPRARHVLRHDLRLARQIFPQEPGEDAGADIDAPACGAPDVDDDRLALEIALGLGACGPGKGDSRK